MLEFIIPHDFETRAVLLVMALMLDAVIGEPEILWRRLPHPVVIFGRSISRLKSWGNRRDISGYARRCRGMIGISILIILAGLSASIVMAVTSVLAPQYGTMVIEVLIVGILVAGRSLDVHVRAVANALNAKDIEAARFHVSMIVGRNPDQLDEPAMARAAIETTAENLSDGVIAPALFYLAFGLPGIIIYKMINTADSMIGYKSKDYLAFGTGAARIDDFANLIPARLTGLLIALAQPAKTLSALGAMIKDAPRHRSPNAGWPEAAMAAILDLALAGPRQYGQRMSQDPAMNATGRRDANAKDITQALIMMWRAIAIFGACLLILGLV